MDATSPRWIQVTPSQHAWEADALDALRSLLPDAEPFRVWTNFEFTDGGRIHEADALAITPKGVFLIEIKSWSGRVDGDQGTWVQQRRDGSRVSYGNPARLNMAKVRSLASLIKRNWRGGPAAPRAPFIESLVWFSNPNLRVVLPSERRPQVAIADDNEEARGHVQTLTEAIIEIGEAESSRTGFRRITADESAEFAKTMARIGFKESTRSRTAGSYVLQLPAFAERGSTQDFMAKHKVHGLPARVRIYSTVVGATPDEAKALRDAANREFMATQNLRIDGVVHARDLDVTEFGPAVVFDQHADAIRLDRFLAERADELNTSERLRIVESIVSTVHQMHRRRISHRMLTPESVWLRPAHGSSNGNGSGGNETGSGPRWEPLISDFSLAARESTDSAGTVSTYTRVGSLPVVRTGAAEVILGDPAMETYLAPETFTDSDPDGVALDAFSIGALTYLLFTGQPPASDRSEMRAALGSSGLSVSAVVAEIDSRIEELVRACTTPIVSERLTSTAEILDRVALALGDDIGAGDEGGEVDPLVAEAGGVLADRFEVKRRLGKGSTAVALWCHDRAHERDVVLKIASKPANDDRLVREGEAITNLRQENVVELHEQLEVGGRRVLVLSFAGERSLAGYLRAEGPVSTDFLRRWGQDLLEAVRYLEKVGVAHRDVKPDNLGIIEMGPRKQSHLVLFDFSLAGTPNDDLTAGTPGYLDPFLSDEGRQVYDLAAERYAAAVTIHEMATGETPTWGDGRSDPAYLPPDSQPTLLVEAIDPEVRGPVVEFLTRALQRDPSQRFDTADDMARAWLAVFADWEQGSHSDGNDDSGTDDTETQAHVQLPDGLSLDDPIASLPTSRKVRSAMRKLGAETVRGVAELDAVSVNRTRGVAVKTRKQVLRLRAAVLERFAERLAEATSKTRGHTVHTTPGSQGDEPAPTGPGTPTDGDPGTAPSPVPAVPTPDIDQLGTFLIPPRGARGRTGSVRETVTGLLGLDRQGTDPTELADWPTATAIAEHLGITRAAASQSMKKARDHWGSSPELMDVAVDLLTILSDLGGVAGVSELTIPLLEARGSGHPPAEAARLTAAVVRAAAEADGPTAELVTVRRSGRRTIVAIDGSAVDAAIRSSNDGAPTAAGEVLARLDSQMRRRLTAVDPGAAIDLAVQLGEQADALVRAEPLVPSGEALAELRSGQAAFGRSLSDARLLRLAGASSDDAMTNAAGDLVRRTASPVEALRWSRAALVSAPRLTAEEIVARVAARFPGTTLPGRPELDEVLARADLKLAWSDEHRSYRSTEAGPGGVGPLTRVTTRQPTVVDTGGATIPPAADAVDPAVAKAIATEQRLDRSLEEGGFLALRVPTDRLAQAQRGLARFQTGHPPMVNIDLEATFLRHLKATAEQRKVAWTNLEGADDVGNPNWERLSMVAKSAVDATIDEVAGHRHVIAWFPGALVRHAPREQLAPMDRLRDAVLDAGHELRTLWLVVLGSTTDALPKVDGTPVPALAGSQWMNLDDTWLKNTHRAGGLTA